MRIFIECSTALPERVYYQSVSLRVSPYILPPTRCYNCQRFGHGALSCRRKARCAKCSSFEHQTTNCSADSPHCFACQAPHATSSIRCRFYKAALGIAAQVQCGKLARSEASLYYASLYSKPENVPPTKPLITPSPATYQSQTPPSSYSFSSSKASRSNINDAPYSPTLPPSVINLHSSTSHSPSTAQSYFLTPAQKKMKNKPIQPTPPHLTPEFAEVLKGNLWYTSQGPCPSPDAPSSSMPNHSSSNSKPTSEQTSSTSESPFLQLLKSLLKPLLQQLLNWIISSLPSDSPIASILSTLLQSISDSFSS